MARCYYQLQAIKLKKLAWLIPLAVSIHCVLTYAWLFIANSDAPSPGKELILLAYFVITTILFLSLKTLKELGISALVSGLLSGFLGLLTIMTYFPGAFPEIDLQTEKYSVLFSGGTLVAFLYIVHGFLYIYFEN